MRSGLGVLFGAVVVLLSLLTTEPQAQHVTMDPIAKRGEELYAQGCTGFCHGPAGAAGSQAPRLANRNFDGQYIERVIIYGVPNTAMPAWGQRLIKEELNQVIAYVKFLNGIAPPSANRAALSLEATAGRDLFFEPTRELGACSNCHSFDGRGIAIVPIAWVPPGVQGLRTLAGRTGSSSQTKTASAGGETFPAVVGTEIKDDIKLYDMTTMPPSLRTFARSAVGLKDGSAWQHAEVLGKYNDPELTSILAYLRETLAP